MSVIIVKGRPVSVRAKSRNKTRWKKLVADAARAVFQNVLNDNDLKITITFFYNTLPDFDTDNICKPICDALERIVYHDDNQLMERHARRRDINGSFVIKGVDPKIALAIVEGEDFVAIKIDKVGRGVVAI